MPCQAKPLNVSHNSEHGQTMFNHTIKPKQSPQMLHCRLSVTTAHCRLSVTTAHCRFSHTTALCQLPSGITALCWSSYHILSIMCKCNNIIPNIVHIHQYYSLPFREAKKPKSPTFGMGEKYAPDGQRMYWMRYVRQKR